jgi:hypothetical protein
MLPPVRSILVESDETPVRKSRRPTTTSEYKSSTMQRYNQCSAVRMYVMSVTHLVLGAVAVKSRSKWFCVPAGGETRGLPPPPPPLGHTLQPGSAHQAGHPVSATPLPGVAESSHIR